MYYVHLFYMVGDMALQLKALKCNCKIKNVIQWQWWIQYFPYEGA